MPLDLVAATYTWDGGGDGVTWTDADNWDLNSNYPGFISGADTAIIGAFSVTLPISAVIDELRIDDGATLTLSGSGPKLTVTDTLRVTSSGGASTATINGVGEIIIGDGSADLSIELDSAADTLSIKAMKIDNSGRTTTLAANETLVVTDTLNWVAGDFTLSTGTTFTHPGMTIPSGETMTCNDATINASGAWTFDGTFTRGTCTVVWTDDGSITGTTAPTFESFTINSGVTVTGSVDFSVDNTWDNDGTFTGSSNAVTFINTITLQGTGTNYFDDLTIGDGSGDTITLSGGDASTIHIQDTLTIEGVLACGGVNTITVDGTWDNNNGASGFDEGADPASTGEGSRVVFGGTTCYLPDVDEVFMDLEIKSTVSAVARAHYYVNRTWWASTDKFSPGSYVVTFDTTLEYQAPGNEWDTRGILQGEATFNIVHINEGDTAQDPNKSLVTGAVMNAAAIHIDDTELEFKNQATIRTDKIVFGTDAEWHVENFSGTPTLMDRGSRFSFSYRGNEPYILGMRCINIDSEGMVFESTSDVDNDELNGVVFTRTDIGETGVYLNFKCAGAIGNIDVNGFSFDNNCEYSVRTVSGFNGTVYMEGYGGAKGGEANEDDEEAGVVTNGTIRWPAFHWTGAVDSDANDAGNWYPSGGPPGTVDTAIVSTDDLNVCNINVDESWGGLYILSGGVVTQDNNDELHIDRAGIFIEGDTGNGPGILCWESSASDDIQVVGDVINEGLMIIGFNIDIEGDLINRGTLLVSKQTSSTEPMEIEGDFVNESTGVVYAGDAGWELEGGFINEGAFNAETCELRFYGNGTANNLTSGGTTLYNVRLYPPDDLTQTINATDALTISGELRFDGSRGNNNEMTLNIQTSLSFTGSGDIDTSYNDVAQGIIQYSGSAAQNITIPPSTGDNYFTLKISNTHGSGATFLAGVTTADNAFFVDSGCKAAAAPGSYFRLTGDWGNDGTFDVSDGTVILGGGGTRTIGGASVSAFNDFRIENGTTVDVDVSAVGRTDEVEIANTWRNDGTFSAGASMIIFTGAPTGNSLSGVSTTTFDTIKITGTFNAGSTRFGVDDTFWNAGTFNEGTSKVHFTGSDSQITGTTTFHAVTQDGATLTLGAGDDITVSERFALWADSTLTMNGSATLRLGKGMKVYGTFSADGSTPTIRDTGTDFSFAISGSSATVDINKINFTNPDNNGLVVENGVTNSQIDLDGIAFTNDDLAQTGTYLQLLPTAISSGDFNFSGCSFDNNCEFNVSTVNNAGVVDGAVTMSGYSGSRGTEAYENDKEGGEVADQSIQWPNKLWVGSVSQSWNDGNNWSPTGVPGATDTVVIPKVADGNDSPIIDTSPVTIQSLQVNSGGVLTRDNTASGYTMSVVSSVLIKEDAGDGKGALTFDAAGTSAFSCDGDLTNKGTFNFGSTTLTINGSLDNYGDFINNGTATTVQGNVTNQSGARLETSDSLTVTGNWDDSGSLVAGTGTVTFDGTGTVDTGGNSFYNLGIPVGASPTSTSALQASNVLMVRGTLNLQSSITFGSRFDEWAGTIEFNGTGAQSVPVEDYYNLIVDKASGTATMATGTSSILGDLTISQGTLDAGSATINFEGNLVNNGTFTPSTSTVVFTKTGSQEVRGSSSTNFNNLTIDSGATLEFNNTETPANTVEIKAVWLNNGTFTPSDAHVKFTTASGDIQGTTTTTFDTVEITSSGTLQVSNAENRLHVGSEFKNDGSFTAGTTRMVFVGTGTWTGSSMTTVNTLEVLDSLTLGDGDSISVTTMRIWNSGSFTINGSATLTFASGGTLGVDGSMTLSGSTPTLTTSSGQFTFDVQNSGSLDINAANVGNLDGDGIHINSTASSTIDIDNANFTDATAGATGIYIKWEEAGATAGEYVFSGCSFDANCEFNIQAPASAAAGAFTMTGAGGAKGDEDYEDDPAGSGKTTGASSKIDWPSVVWDGGAGTSNWGDAANWDPDGVPGFTDNVKIPTTPTVNFIFPMLNVAAEVGSLTVEDGASVTSDGGARNLTVNGSLTIEVDAGAGADGVITWDSTGTLRVDGQVTLNGRLVSTTTGLVDLNSGVTTGTGSDFWSTGSGIVDIEGALTASGDVNIGSLFVGGNFDTSAGSFVSGTSVVTLDGASGSIDVGSDSFYRLSVPAGSEYTSDGTNTLTVNDRLVVGGTLNIAGPSSISGSLDPITGTIRYSGTSAQNIDTLNFYNLQVTNTSANVSFQAGTTSIANDFTIADNATVLGTTALIQVTGDWVNNDTFTPGTSVVSFDGSNSTIEGDSSTTFGSLFIASGAALDVNTTASPADELTLNADFVNDGTFTYTGSHVYFGSSSTLKGSSVTTFDDVTINASSTLTMGGVNRFDFNGTFTDNGTFTAPATSVVGTTEGSGKVLAGSAGETVFVQLEILGDLTSSSNSLAVTTLNVWGTGSLDIVGSTTLSLGTAGAKGAASVYGSFSSSGSTPIVTDKGMKYSFDVLGGGTVDIDALNFEDPDDDGLHINSDASTSFDIDGVTFSDNTAGATGTYLQLSLASIPASTYSFNSMSFDSNCQYNVSTPASAADDAVTCPGWGGAKGGETYENDKASGTIASGGSITWPQKQWNGSVDSKWSEANNWTPSGVPTAGDNVTITDGVTHYPWINITTTVGSLTIQDNAVVTASNTSVSFTVSGGVEIDAPAAGSDVSGVLSWDSSGTLAIGSTLDVDGHLTLANSSSTITVAGNTTVGSANGWLRMTVDVNDFDIDGDLVNGNELWIESVKVGGDWDNNDTFVNGSGTVTLDGATGSIETNDDNFHNLFVATGASYEVQSGGLVIDEALVVPGTLQVATSLTFGNLFNEETGTIEFTGTSAQTVPQEVYYNLTISTTGGNGTLGSSYVQVGNDLTIGGSSTATADASDLWITGDLVNNGTWRSGSGAVSFCGASSQVQGSGQTDFHDLYVRPGATLQFNNSSGNDPSIENDWINNGTFTAGSSTVIFSGNDSLVGGTSLTTFDNVTVGSGAQVTFRMDGASHNHVGIKSALTNNGTISTALGAGGRDNTVVFPASTGSLAGSASTTVKFVEVYGTLTLGSGDDLSATAFLVSTGGNLTAGGTSILRLGEGGRTGALTVDGTSSTVSTSGTPLFVDKGAEWRFDVQSSGIIGLDGGTLRNLDDNGLNIAASAGAGVDIDGVTFENDDADNSSGIYIQVGYAAIASNTYTWESCVFNAGAQFNVQTQSVAGTPAINMSGWSGARGGSDYENDEGAGQNDTATSSIDWPEKTWDGSESSLWGTADNWTPSGVPGAGERALIPAGVTHFPYFNGSFSVGSIVVKSGAVVTNNGTSNNVTVNGSIELEYDTGSGQGALTFDASSGSMSANSVSSDGTLHAANNTFTVNGNVQSSRWLRNTSTLLDVNGDLTTYSSGSYLIPGRLNLSGNLTINTGGLVDATGSVLTFDGTAQQDVTLASTSWEVVHSTGSGTVAFQDSFTLVDTLAVNSGTVTFGGITLTLSNGAHVDVSSLIRFDGTTLTNGGSGFDFSVNSGGDIWAKQTTRFNNLTDTGMVFRTGAKIGTNTTGSDGSENFRYVTFDGIGATGTGMDFSGFVAGDADSIPDTIREVRFNGSAGGVNVKIDQDTDPEVTFRLFTGDFGTLAANGEDADSEPGPSNRLIWNTNTTYVSLRRFAARGWLSDATDRADGPVPLDEDLMRLEWETIVEISNLGFNIYRSRERHGEYVKLTSELIPPGGTQDGMTGYSYTWVDDVPARGETWYYKLEDVDENGTRTFHGPICTDWDRDGMPDDWEIANGFDKLDPTDANGDADGDGLSNLDEYRYGQDPHNEDTDGDGIKDGDEDLNIFDGSDEAGLLDGLLAGGSGLKVIGQDALGMTLEFQIDDLLIEEVTHSFSGYPGNDAVLWNDRWRSWVFNRIRFDGLPTDYAAVQGDPRLPVKRALLNLPQGRVPMIRILDQSWGPDRQLTRFLEPVPRIEDRPALVTRKKNIVKIVQKTVLVKKDITVESGYQKKIRTWASLFMSRKRFERDFLHETKTVTEEATIEEEVKEEILVTEPSTSLVDIHEMNTDLYPSVATDEVPYAGASLTTGTNPATIATYLDGAGKAPRFSLDDRTVVGDKEAFLMTLQPVSYSPTTGRVRHLRRIRFRVDYVWDPDNDSTATSTWRSRYAKIDEAKPEWLEAEQAVEITIRKPAYSNSGDVDDAGIYKVTTAELAAAGLDTAPLAVDPGRLRIFCGNTELSLGERPGEWLFFADSGLFETLYNDRVKLQAIVDLTTAGKRWSQVASELTFDREITEFQQTIRFERNGTFSPIYQEGTPDSFFVHPSSVYKTQTRAYNFFLPNPKSTGQATIRARLFGGYDYEPEFDQGAYLKLNNFVNPFGSGFWKGHEFDMLEGQIDLADLTPATNQFKVQGIVPTAIPRTRVRLDWFDVTYPRQMISSSNRLLVDTVLQGGATRLHVTGFANPGDISVLDVSDSGEVFEYSGMLAAGDAVTINVRRRNSSGSVVYPNFLRMDSDYGTEDPRGRGALGLGLQTGEPGRNLSSVGVARDNHVRADGGASHSTDQRIADETMWPLGDRVIDPDGSWGLTGYGPYLGGVAHQGNRILFSDLSQARSVESVILRMKPDSAVRGRRSAVDHLIVVDESLLTEAQRLADHLAEQTVPSSNGVSGLSGSVDRDQIVELVTFQQLCREYTHGLYTSAAIDLYVKERFRTADVWEDSEYVGKPKHLTIIGSGNINTKGIWGFATEKPLIPTVVLRGGVKVTAADGAFGLVTDDPYQDLAVARIDVGTPIELATVVDKVIDYDSRTPLSEPKAVLVADDETSFNDEVFLKTLDKSLNSFEAPWTVSKLYKRDLTAAAITQGIVDALNDESVAVLVYNGHGNFTDWGSENYWNTSKFGSLTSGHWLPLVIEANCLSSDWFHLSPRSLGTLWLQQSNKGAIAVIGTTGRTDAGDKEDVLLSTIDNLVRRGKTSFGEALRRAKLEALTRDVVDPTRAIISQHLLGVSSERLKAD